MKKRKLSAVVVLLLIVGLVISACGTNDSSGSNTGTQASGGSNAGPKNSAAAGTGDKYDGNEETPVKITILNSKGQIAQVFEEAAAAFSAANPNIEVEVITVPSGQSPFERVSVLYASGTPPTLSMLDAGDIPKFQDKALDLSGEKWVNELSSPNEIDGKTLAFPFAIEGYGIVYNKAVMDEVAGGAFDPASIKSLSDLEDLFKTVEAAGKKPFILGSMHWSLGNHMLPLAYVTQPEGVEQFLANLKAGQVDLASNGPFNGLLDTLDLLKKYNAGKDDPMAVTAETIAAEVATGNVAMTFNGNWMISQLEDVSPNGEYGFIPFPLSNNSGDRWNSSIAVGATKQMFIDKTVNTVEQQNAAKKFLEWLVYDETGQDYLVNKMKIIPAYKTDLIMTDPLGKSIQSYMASGNTLPFGANYVPGDHSSTVGAIMQKYLVDKVDRAGLAKELEDYWKRVQ